VQVTVPRAGGAERIEFVRMNCSMRWPARVLSFAATVLFVLAGATATARAQSDEEAKKKARTLYEQAEKAYNLGKFDDAVDGYTKAYEAWPRPLFLFNIAQAYRQAGNCKSAVFFYKRFLAVSDNDAKNPLQPSVRDEVQGRISELEECVKREIANKPPDQQMRPDPDGNPSPNNTTPSTTPPDKRVATTDPNEPTEEPEEPGIEKPLPFGQPTTLALRFGIGPSNFFFGSSVPPPLQASFAVTGGYPIPIDPQLTVEVGGQGGLVTLKDSQAGVAYLVSALVNAGATYAINEQIDIHADLGIGAAWMVGLNPNNLFIESPTMGRPDLDVPDGPFALFDLRVAVAGEYAITPNLVASVMPAFSYTPRRDDMEKDITAMSRVDILVGIGLRM